MCTAISFQCVSKKYSLQKNVTQSNGSKSMHMYALNQVSFDIEEGDFFGLLGPNGAGKTTLINILSGLSYVDSGKVLLKGKDIKLNAVWARRQLGVVPQELVFDPFFSVREMLRIQSGYFGIRRNDSWIDELLHSLGLFDKAETNLRHLSGGMKRRVMVAQALVHRPPVIVLDEPTAGVDVELRQALWKFIKRLNQQGHTILLTTHYLEEAEALCKRIGMLKQGSLVALDDTANLLNSTYSQVLRLRINGEWPPDLSSLMESARITGNIAQWSIKDAFSIERILSQLRQFNVLVDDVEVHRSDLEDVFLEVMQSHDKKVQ